VDRYLVAAESQSIPAVILFNKMDLAGGKEALAGLSIYRDLGYSLTPVSALTGEGLEEIREPLSEGLSVLVGHSGVGKSALLNRLVPDAELRTRELSEATRKGVHTTSVVTAHSFGEGILVDTPGIREFGLVDVEPEDLSAGFREIAAMEGGCRFSNCSHREEPGCAIRKAVEEGGIILHRYESYLRICESLEAGER
jgi:ribosome biogenesis GTPase